MLSILKKQLGKALVKKHAQTMIEAARAKEKQQENDLLAVANKNNTPFMKQTSAAEMDKGDAPKTALQRFMEKQEQLEQYAKILKEEQFNTLLIRKNQARKLKYLTKEERKWNYERLDELEYKADEKVIALIQKQEKAKDEGL